MAKAVLTKNSKKAIIPTMAKTWANPAMTDPNLTQQLSNMGPINNDKRKNVNNMAAFHTTGPKAIIPIRTKALGGWLPSGFGKDLRNA